LKRVSSAFATPGADSDPVTSDALDDAVAQLFSVDAATGSPDIMYWYSSAGDTIEASVNAAAIVIADSFIAVVPPLFSEMICLHCIILPKSQKPLT
jgi:hypothetical protein